MEPTVTVTTAFVVRLLQLAQWRIPFYSQWDVYAELNRIVFK